MPEFLLQAAAPLLQPLFTVLGSAVTALELVAFVLSVAMVIGNLRVRVWAWPLAIASSACYALLFAASRLYGEATLQLLFIALSFWGWLQWWRDVDGRGAPLTVGSLSARDAAIAVALTLAAWPLLGLLLARTTDTDVPYADALPTVASVLGQILLARKRIENWAVWLAVNIFSVGLFAYKGLLLTVVLYALFAVLSVAGWRAWQRLLMPAAGGAPAKA